MAMIASRSAQVARPPSSRVNKLKVKKGDNVMVITGKDKGKTGEIVTVLPKTSRVIVRGVSVAKRHTAQSQTSQGGILDKELSVHVSNVSHIDPKDKKASKIGYKLLKDGRKVRFLKRSGDLLD